jgi:hypothetical protein
VASFPVPVHTDWAGIPGEKLTYPEG